MAKLATRRWGDSGPRAVLVHGMTAWSNTWWRIGPALAERGWDVTAVDLRGHGNSPRAGATMHLDELGADLVETIGSGVDLLVGHSLGALAGLSALNQESKLASRVVLEEPPGMSNVDRELLAALVADDFKRAHADRDEFAAHLSAQNPRWDERDVAARVEGLLHCDGEAIVRATEQRDLNWNLVELVAPLELPLLVLLAVDGTASFGAEEGGSGLVGEERATFIEALGENEHVVIDGGHCIHRSEPRLWLERVLDFAT
ncbi:MAG TPA: alpha/beta fold hydrolase [Actinomycetota bacterium]|nr:alpha/beta fold hydrolase [Actinomycetota bacterium]